MTLNYNLLKTLRTYWIIPVSLTVSSFVIFLVVLFLPPVSPECFKPGVLCEPSPLPMFAGLGSIVGIITLYKIINKPDDNIQREK